MSAIPAPLVPTTHPVLASSSVIPSRHHPSHVSPLLVPGNTFPITTSSALPPPPPQPSLPTPPRSSWIESLRSLARSNLFRDTVSTYVDMMALVGIPPDQFAFPAVLKATTASGTSILGGRFTPKLLNLGMSNLPLPWPIPC
ncbi:hypothetical protein NL676_027938 [Syzygium grande]|nr:hypothetical protein NL676_027938 [Syzygium grande]